MPTASGRETAQEKRDRQHAARWAKIEAAIEAMPPGRVERLTSEYVAAYNAELARLDHPGDIRSVSLVVDTEPEAVAVCRAAKARGAGSPLPVLSYDLRYGGETRLVRGFAQWRDGQPAPRPAE